MPNSNFTKINTCYDNLIGLASVNHNCTPEIPVELQGSKSGLYISDLQVLDLISADFKEDILWVQLDEARQQASLFFIAETNALLQRKVRTKMQHFSGKIGEPNANAFIPYDSAMPYQGVRIYCNPMRSATILLKSVSLSFDHDDNQQLYIFDKNNTMIFYQDNIDVQISNGKATVPINLTLPTVDDFGAAEYFIFYANHSDNLAKANELVCPDCTGFMPTFSKTNPHFGRNIGKGIAWANWIMVQGIQFQNLTQFSDFDNADANYKDNAGMGIQLDISVGCSIDKILCEQAAAFSFSPFAMSIAKAIQLKSAELFINMILSSQKISRTTMINHEHTAAMRQEWRTEYIEILQFITSNIDVSDTDCFNCKALLDMRLNSILS